MEIQAIWQNPKDSVVTVTKEVRPGDVVLYEGGRLTAEDFIPQWQKIALVDLPVGTIVYKYGEEIGKITSFVAKGHRVDDHNLEGIPRKYEDEYVGDIPWEGPKFTPYTDEPLYFRGYRRSEGRPGVRNHILFLPTCACSSETCRVASSLVRGSVHLTFDCGCADVGANEEISQRILMGFALHPNVYGVVIIGLGCEAISHRELKEKLQKLTKKPIISFGIQEEGGTLRTIEKAVRAGKKLAAEASMQEKEKFPISELLLGIECGGSDATSGIAANPAVGNMSDRLIDMGGSAMISESIEWIGADHILARRGLTANIHDEIIRTCEAYENHISGAGQNCREGQPAPGNKAGGLSTLEEKSLGCIKKGGTRPVVEVLEQAQRPAKSGALVMDTAGFDVSSITSMAAAGCQIIIFTTGLGTPTGLSMVPVCKVTANEHTASWMEDNLDVDLSPIVRGEETIEEGGKRLLLEMKEIADGKVTKAEAYGFSDIAVDHVCRYV